MDKTKLVASVAKGTQFARWEVNKVITSAFCNIVETLRRGDDIYVKGLGRFEPKVRKGKIVMHPITRKATNVPDKLVVAFTLPPSFKATQEVIDSVNTRMYRLKQV